MESKGKVLGLTQEEKDKALAWLKKSGGDRALICAVCRQTKWTMGDHLVAPMVYQQGGLILGGPTYPSVMLICINCGHTLFLNAMMMGLVPSAKDAQEGKAEVKEKEGSNG